MGVRKSFSELLDSGQFILSAELTPPRHYDLSDFLHKAEIVEQYVDVLQINDHLLSKARITNLVVGQYCKSQGMDPVLQFTLRHKNRIAIQGDLLGLAASGIENIIVLGGYPCSLGEDHSAKNVNDINCLEAVEKISRLTREGKLFNGDQILPPPKFRIGIIDFPCDSTQTERHLDRLEAKIEAGAEFVQLQAIFELESMHKWMEEIEKRQLHKKARFFGAVFPFNGLERLKVLSEIPGLKIPSEVVQRMQKNNCSKEGLDITIELMKGLHRMEGISGIHIRSVGAEDWVPRIVEASGLGGELIY